MAICRNRPANGLGRLWRPCAKSPPARDAPPSARVSAAVALLDRGYGKPPQAIDAKVTAEASPAYWHLEALKELAERAKQSKLARQAQEAMIDVTPVTGQGQAE